MTMPNVPALEILPLPEQIPAPIFDSDLVSTSPTPLQEIPTGVPNLDAILDPGPSRVSTPSNGLIWGILPVVFLVAGVIIIRFLFRRNG